LKSVIVPSVQSPPSMLKLHDFCNRAMMEVEDIDNLSRNQDIAVGLQVILKPRARPTPTWTSMPERTLDFEF
ncbi:hypothetical protein, partial [Pseudomonas aeruginosa]|uniref:hypothetical protein n=1 Tax=Pseudomonas aeruginosa TaxID=287 RepID=UPI003B589B18